MKKGRFTEEQIIGILKQHEAGRKVPELAREIGVSAATIYTWKSRFGGMDVSDAQKLKGLEDENRRLKHLVADLSLDREVLKAVAITVVIGLVVSIIALAGQIKVTAFELTGSYDKPIVIFIIGLTGALVGAQLLMSWIKKLGGKDEAKD